MADSGSKKLHMVLALLLVIGAGAFVYGRYRSARPASPTAEAPPPAPPGDAPPGARRPPLPSKEEREKERQRMLDELQLSADQLAKLKEISSKYKEDEGPQVLGSILKDMGPHLSKDQQVKARNYFEGVVRKQVMTGAGNLPADQQQKLLQKLNEKSAANQPPQ